MIRPAKLDDASVDSWVATHSGWERVSQKAIEKTFKFPDFATAMGFTVRVGLLAERRDHHPDIELGWGRASVSWSTHDANGITKLDLELAELTDRCASGTTRLNDAISEARAELLSWLKNLLGEAPVPRFAEALTHPSFSNETNDPNNQRLEFLGDAVLGLCVSEELVAAHPDADEGKLTRMRAALVNAEALAMWGRERKLGECLALGRGARAGSERAQTNVLADAVEALVAAVYEAHGLEGARTLVRDITTSGARDASALEGRDPKSELQELVQARGLAAPTYHVVKAHGLPHEPVFEVSVIVAGEAVGVGEGRSKRIAERTAAASALRHFAEGDDDDDG